MDETKPTLLFLDMVCPKPYDPEHPGSGGTEQTVTTIAENLAKTGLMRVVCEQHNRYPDQLFEGRATYAPLDHTTTAKWVVVLRDPRSMPYIRDRFPGCKLYLWSHDLADENIGRIYQTGIIQGSGCLANVCVSNFHRTQTIEVLRRHGFKGEFKHRVLYNPLDEDVVYRESPYDRHKLIWLASPHKGLYRAFECLRALIKRESAFKLYVANPGYMEDRAADSDLADHVVALGSLPHAQALEELRSSLCLFYPNHVYPETFGKILTESNAIGVPVIAHDMGAAREVLDGHPDQLTDCRNTEAVVNKVLKWSNGQRPRVRCSSVFRIPQVLKTWLGLLDDLRT